MQKGPEKTSSLGNATKCAPSSCSSCRQGLQADGPRSLPTLTSLRACAPAEAKRPPRRGKPRSPCTEPCWKVAGGEDAALQPNEMLVPWDLDGSAAVLQRRRRMHRAQAHEADLNHLQAPWLSACQDGCTALQRAAVCTHKQAAYANGESDYDDESSLSWGPMQTEHAGTQSPSGMELVTGACCWVCNLPAQLFPAFLPRHPAGHSSGKPAETFARRICRLTAHHAWGSQRLTRRRAAAQPSMHRGFPLQSSEPSTELEHLDAQPHHILPTPAHALQALASAPRPAREDFLLENQEQGCPRRRLSSSQIKPRCPDQECLLTAS